MRCLVFISILLSIISLTSADEFCSGCVKELSSRYIKDSNGFLYCGKSCQKKSSLSCQTCKRKITGKYKVFNKKPFCSNRCIEPLLPKCISCKVPFTSGVEIYGKHFI